MQCVEFLGAEFECDTKGFEVGEDVTVKVRFEKVDLLDHEDEAITTGHVEFILYMGNHYHLTIKVDGGGFLYVDTNDIWDKGDLVGIHIAAEDLHIRKADESN